MNGRLKQEVPKYGKFAKFFKDHRITGKTLSSKKSSPSVYLQVSPLELYLQPRQTSTMKLFCENS